MISSIQVYPLFFIENQKNLEPDLKTGPITHTVVFYSNLLQACRPPKQKRQYLCYKNFAKNNSYNLQSTRQKPQKADLTSLSSFSNAKSNTAT